MTNQNTGDMHKHSTLIESYRRLLADVCDLSKMSLDIPREITYDWVLKEAPMLDKQCLAYIEGIRNENPEFPPWLRPLWDVFVATSDAIILRWVRQCLLFCYKAEYEPTDEQLKAAQAVFEDTDQSIGIWDAWFTTHHNDPMFRTARRTVARVIGRVDWSKLECSHGPGSVFPSRLPSEKSRFTSFYQTIQEYYPYDQYLWCLPTFWDDIMVKESWATITEYTDIVSRLDAAPKDSRGPRLICVHPSEAIWIQQGQRRLLEAAIERSFLKGKINFTDQTVNGSLALSSSLDREFCTLDLKEASDRISIKLVDYLFGSHTSKILSCARANKVQLLDGRVITLKKWAPMGNCLTFPVQSLIFWSLVHAGIQSRYGTTCNDVYVFGDDILFPVKYYEGAVNALVRAGLVPNSAKTFRAGLFRESCGVDAYRGKDVTPLRIKKHNPSSFEGALALCDVAKRLRRAGYWHCSSYLYKQVASIWGSLAKCNDFSCSGLFEYVDTDLRTLLLYEPRLRWSRRYHKWRVPGWQVRPSICRKVKGEWYHLLDSLTRISQSDSQISDRGTEYPIPYRARLSYGWADCNY